MGFVLSPSLLSRRRILEGAAALAASSALPGCGGSSASSGSGTGTGGTPVSGVSNPQATPSGAVINASVAVAATSAGTLGNAFAGLSYEKSTLYEPLFTATNTNLIGLFKRLGTSVLRVGGNSVDRNVWTANGAGQTAGQIAPSDVTALAAFVKATGWQCIYGVNLGGSATGATTPALAAAEVAYAAAALGSSLLGIEIGNECDLYGSSYYASGWSLTQFETLWEQYRTAIVAATPGVAVTGPADSGNESSWTVPFGQFATKSQISLLTQHYYRGDGSLPTSTAAYLITADSSVVKDAATLQTGAAAIGIPWRMAECNSYYNGGASGVSNAYCSSLWVIDFLFNLAQGGAAGANLHGGGNGAGYTPIADSSGVVVGARPEYYGMLMFTLAGQGTLYQTTVSASSLNVTAYAVKTATGLNVVIINKDPTNNLLVTLTLPQTVATATLLEMTQLTPGSTVPSISATTGVTIQGSSVGVDGTFVAGTANGLTFSGTSITCYAPLLSAVLVQVS